jgi:anti-sigma-K factor RskA
MNYNHPELLDKIAGEYALGTLSPGANRRFRQLLDTSAMARSAALRWEDRLHKLAGSVPREAPPEHLWAKVEARIRPAASASATRSPPWWRAVWKPALGFAFGALMTVGLVRMQPDALVSVDEVAELQQALPQSYVGLLLDTQGQPALLVSATRHGKRVTVKSLQPLQVPTGKVLRVWALPKDGPPFPLGIAIPTEPPGNTTFDMAATSEALLSRVQRLVVSVEPTAWAAPGAAPIEPFLLTGNCVKLW